MKHLRGRAKQHFPGNFWSNSFQLESSSYQFDKFYLLIFETVMKMPSWMPGAGFKRQAREWRIPTLAMVERPFEKVKKDLVGLLI